MPPRSANVTTTRRRSPARRRVSPRNPVRARLVVAIVGGTASGKSTLARSLAELLHPYAHNINLDSFYRCSGHLPASRRNRLNFDHPRRIDWASLNHVLDLALRGKAFPVPRYNFESHAREETHDTLHPRPVLIIDGLWLLRRRDIRARCGLRIFVECPAEIRLRRRIRRDRAERGRTRAQVLAQWQHQSEPGFRRFVEPQRNHAHTIVRSPVSRRQLTELSRLVQSRIDALP